MDRDEWWNLFRAKKLSIKQAVSYLYFLYDYWDGFPQGVTFKEIDELEGKRDTENLVGILNRILLAVFTYSSITEKQEFMKDLDDISLLSKGHK